MKKIVIHCLEAITIIGGVLLVLMIFLPYASSNEKHKTYLTKYKDEICIEELNMTNEEVIDLSLIEYVSIYKEAISQGMGVKELIIPLILVLIYIFCALGTMLVAFHRQTVNFIIFDMITMFVFMLIGIENKHREAFPSYKYDWGITNILVYIIGVIIHVAAIVVHIMKKNQDKVDSRKD